MKTIIVNADDYGYNQEQTESINELITQKLITSTSFLCVTPYSERAAKSAKEHQLSVGVHLTINSDSAECPWKSLSGAKSLCGERESDLCKKVPTFKARRGDVAKELEAQYQYLRKRGITVTHADNHCGTLYGINGRRFYIDAFDFCQRHNLPFRFPKTPNFIASQLGIKTVPKVIVAFQKAIVARGLQKGIIMLDDLVSNPYGMDKIHSRNDLEQYYLNAIDNAIDGVTEIFLHPAREMDDESGAWQKRVFEYEILKSGNLLQKAEDKHIKVISWSEYAQLAREKTE